MLTRERRLTILAACLLVALAWYLYPTFSAFVMSGGHGIQQVVPPGENAILSVRLAKVDAYHAELDVDYFFNGASGATAWITADAPLPRPTGTMPMNQPVVVVRPGKGTARTRLIRFGAAPARVQTGSVTVVMKGLTNSTILLEKSVDLVINWPSTDRFSLASNDPAEIERLYSLCVLTIDVGAELQDAKRGLEEILLADPNYVPVYAELARYRMKTNWSAEGLAQAEQLLESARRIDPKHANTLVLLGYVYAHQKRFKEAEQVLHEAETIGTRNIWLYSNLGELYAMQGKKVDALAAYGRAIDAPDGLPTYERARDDAYRSKLALLATDHQWKDLDDLYARRAEKFPRNACYRAEHADFVLRRLGDADRAVTIAKAALDQGCGDNARSVLGMAYFVQWAAALKSGTSAAEADSLFNRGLALSVPGPNLIYGLATSAYTAQVIAPLKQRGIQIDVGDSRGMNALLYSVGNRDLDALRTLVGNGANVNYKGADDFTPLMMAASIGDEKAAAFLLKSGASRAARTRSGFTAEQIARQAGFAALAKKLAQPAAT